MLEAPGRETAAATAQHYGITMGEAIHAHLLDSIAGYLKSVSESMRDMAVSQPAADALLEDREDRLAAV